MAANPPPPKPPGLLAKIQDAFANYGAELVVGAVLIAFAVIAVVAVGPGLLRLADPGVARGLITVAITIGTIFVALALVSAALFGLGEPGEAENRFKRGREVLSALVGILGTIVGFYFGSAQSGPAKTLSVDARLVGPDTSGVCQVVASIRNGTPPFRYQVIFAPSNAAAPIADRTSTDGWVLEQFKLATTTQEVATTLIVTDAGGSVVTKELKITAAASKPPTGAPPAATTSPGGRPAETPSPPPLASPTPAK